MPGLQFDFTLFTFGRFVIIDGMSRWFNIGGPCNSADHYMLAAVERLPEVVSLIRKKQYFVVHAPRQCGKTTAFQALADEINAKGEMVALYCSVENAQGLDDPARGLPSVVGQVRAAVDADPAIFGNVTTHELVEAVKDVELSYPDARPGVGLPPSDHYPVAATIEL